MKALPHTSRQLALGLDPTPSPADFTPIAVPAGIEADVIGALATLLLEAAGISSGATEGGADESEDHA